MPPSRRRGPPPAGHRSAASPLAHRYLVRVAPDSYKSLKRAKLKSFVLPIDTFVRGGPKKCDLYIIGSYDNAYNQPGVQSFFQDYVNHGKGLFIVGPDVMVRRSRRTLRCHLASRLSARAVQPAWG
jgi:hypothetical protein